MTVNLAEIQDQLLEALHRGEPLDREAVLARHPEHAEALRGFFRVLEAIEAPPAPPTPARLGDFQIVRELGRGGMGIVYEAMQLSLKRRVALKILPPALGGSSVLAQRFRREAEAAGRLRHPCIVPVYSSGEVADTPFFAMELVEGRSLADVIADLRAGHAGGVPPVGEQRRKWAVELAAKVADALAYAHEQGIVHRDVKPANIMLERDGTPRLSDFGLALDTALESLTLAGDSFGSPRYMSPEQAFRRERPVDGRSDVYSLGVTLFELLTLGFPYRGASSGEYLSELSQGKLVRPSELDPSMPTELEAVLLRALAREPEQRYRTAAEFAQDLREWGSSEWLHARAPKSSKDSRTSVARESTEDHRGAAGRVASVSTSRGSNLVPWLVATVVAVFVSGIALVVIMLWRANTAQVQQARAAAEDARVEAELARASFTRAHAVEELVTQDSGRLSSAEVRLIADSSHPHAENRLKENVFVAVNSRDLLARGVPTLFEVRVGLPIEGSVPPGVELFYRYSLRTTVDGVVTTVLPRSEFAPLEPDPNGCGAVLNVSLDQFWRAFEGRELPAEPLSLELLCDLRIRGEHSTETFNELKSTTKDVRLVERFPDDYPRPVAGAEAGQMNWAMKPEALRFSRVASPGLARVVVVFFSVEQAFDAAGRLELFDADTDLNGHAQPLAIGAFQRGAHEDPFANERTMTVDLQLAPTSGATASLIDRIASGEIKTLRARLVYDREVALTMTTFESVWTGTVSSVAGVSVE